MQKLKQFFIDFNNRIFHTEKFVPEIEWPEHLHTEHQQLKLRYIIYFVMMTIGVSIGLGLYKTNDTPQLKFAYLMLGSMGFTAMTLQYLLFRLKKKQYPKGWRILLGQFSDNFFLSGAIAYGQADDSVVPYFTPIYAFLILGNGMRFGITHLITTMIFSILGFSWAFYSNPFLINNYKFSIAVYMNFVIISLYTTFLIKRLNEVKESLMTAQQSKINTLQEVGKLKSQFFANISHEFRTPIAVTLATIEAIMGSEFIKTVQAKTQEQLDVIRRNQKRLMALINQILDLEKLEKGKMLLKAQRIKDPKSFVETRAMQIKPLAVAKGLQFDCQLDEKITSQTVYIDPGMIDKCIYNLLSNAIKFTEKGRVQIVSTVDEKYWSIAVKDSGVGIKESELPRVFERFHQASGSESKDYAGTGIGLALVKEVVDLHKGEIEVQSVYGQGTTFTLKLRLGKSHLPADQVIDVVYDESGAEVSEGHVEVREGKENTAGINETMEWNKEQLARMDKDKKTVLFVDDNYDLRKFIKDALEHEYNVLLGVDGLHGLEMVQKHPVHLIISDQMMPNMNGTEFLKRLKQDSNFAQIPFIILTANVSPESKIESLRLGADDFLYKPFYVEEVRVRIQNLVALREQQVRIAEDLKAARAIQQSLLPPLELRASTYSLEAYYKPCEFLSGDFFDTWSEQSKLIFYTADVTSHGVASAQVTYIVKSIFTKIVEDGGFNLKADEILRRFIKAYVENKIDYGVSIQIFTFNAETQVLTMAHSAAPPAFLISADKVEVLSPRSSCYIHHEVVTEEQLADIEMLERVIHPDEILMCYTDGAYERKQGIEELSLRRFANLLKPTMQKSDWSTTIQSELESYHQTSSFVDDVTILKFKLRKAA